MAKNIEQLENQLDDFDSSVRSAALKELVQLADSGEIALPERTRRTNVHFHTFFSFNYRGYSPSKIAWLACKEGLGVAGIVDFDVLHGLEEFYAAGDVLGLRTSVGMETRVFVPEFADKEINSPGEPGISYHMGVGFPTSNFTGKWKEFGASLQQMAQQRNRELLGRVNAHLKEIELDYDRDVLSLVPSRNATERHICVAYARKAAELFKEPAKIAEYWSEKLGKEIAVQDVPETVPLLNAIRAGTMKRGGVGYMQPDSGSFPKMAEVNEFVLEVGGIATLTWLNGMSDGEKEIERLVEISMQSGTEMVNIIPDRNYTPGEGVQNEKCKNLYDFVKLAESLDLPIIVGTEMNSPGQKFVDAFETEELQLFTDVFYRGALVGYAHAMLQRHCGIGYSGEWAKKHFGNRKEKNEFFEQIGATLDPAASLQGIDTNATPGDIVKRISK